MTTTLHLPEELVRQIESHAAREGAAFDTAVAELLHRGLLATRSESSTAEAELLARRQELIDKFVAGECGVDLTGYEEGRDADRRDAAGRANAWRD